jgi:BolA protein
VVVVSDDFESVKSLVQRHRMVNECLKEQLDGPVHALSIVAKSPTQWQKMVDDSEDGKVPIEPSPNCRGGDGSLPRKNPPGL